MNGTLARGSAFDIVDAMCVGEHVEKECGVSVVLDVIGRLETSYSFVLVVIVGY